MQRCGPPDSLLILTSRLISGYQSMVSLGRSRNVGSAALYGVEDVWRRRNH